MIETVECSNNFPLLLFCGFFEDNLVRWIVLLNDVCKLQESHGFIKTCTYGFISFVLAAPKMQYKT